MDETWYKFYLSNDLGRNTELVIALGALWKHAGHLRGMVLFCPQSEPYGGTTYYVPAPALNIYADLLRNHSVEPCDKPIEPVRPAIGDERDSAVWFADAAN